MTSFYEDDIAERQYLETYLNIADPLVVIASLIYIQDHYDCGLCHISNHLPKSCKATREALSSEELEGYRGELGDGPKLFGNF